MPLVHLLLTNLLATPQSLQVISMIAQFQVVLQTQHVKNTPVNMSWSRLAFLPTG